MSRDYDPVTALLFFYDFLLLLPLDFLLPFRGNDVLSLLQSWIHGKKSGLLGCHPPSSLLFIIVIIVIIVIIFIIIMIIIIIIIIRVNAVESFADWTILFRRRLGFLRLLILFPFIVTSPISSSLSSSSSEECFCCRLSRLLPLHRVLLCWCFGTLLSARLRRALLSQLPTSLPGSSSSSSSSSSSAPDPQKSSSSELQEEERTKPGGRENWPQCLFSTPIQGLYYITISCWHLGVDQVLYMTVVVLLKEEGERWLLLRQQMSLVQKVPSLRAQTAGSPLSLPPQLWGPSGLTLGSVMLRWAADDPYMTYDSTLTYNTYNTILPLFLRQEERRPPIVDGNLDAS
ncbi:hypothetical protein INR49_016757 [Caranx melampygus]|nr:hypothetical protein INR49_016757 [Caranx melampygus]